MRKLRNWQGAAVVLACCGLLLPPQPLNAEGVTAAAAASQTSAIDVKLSASGALVGSVHSPTGQTIDGAAVALLQGEKVVARTTSDKTGIFAVAQVPAGVYTVVVGNQGAPIRVWSSATAPPAARERAVLVVGKTVVRGQGSCPDPNCPGCQQCSPDHGAFFGLDVITLVTLGSAVTAAVLAGINQKDLDDLEDKVDQLLSP